MKPFLQQKCQTIILYRDQTLSFSVLRLLFFRQYFLLRLYQKAFFETIVYKKSGQPIVSPFIVLNLTISNGWQYVYLW